MMSKMNKYTAASSYHHRNKGYWIDLCINGLLPLFLGWLLYRSNINPLLPALLKSHLADACWAYAFASALLICWNRQIPWYWMAVVVGVAVGFEWLQANGTVPGTADWKDVLAYLISIALSNCFNTYFRDRFSR